MISDCSVGAYMVLNPSDQLTSCFSHIGDALITLALKLVYNGRQQPRRVSLFESKDGLKATSSVNNFNFVIMEAAKNSSERTFKRDADLAVVRDFDDSIVTIRLGYLAMRRSAFTKDFI